MSRAAGRPRHGFDVFMSLSGLDREPVRVLVAALRKAGLTVFMDEDRIPLFAPITAEIEAALSSAKVLVAYYSASFATRPACQMELMAAFVAGQAEGDPTRRIVVINPETGTDHLLPAELADARFAVLPAPRTDRRHLDTIVASIRARVDELPDSLGEVDLSDQPRWLPERVPGAHGFVGRYRELWQIHSALTAPDHSLTHNVTGAPVVVVVGLPGVGKTALAAAYAWHFSATHRGGVYWVSLTGAGETADEVVARYADEVRSVAEHARLPVSGATRSQVFGLLADEIANQLAASLWVIDDLPPDIDPDVLHRLVVPAGSHVHTLVTSQRFGPSRLVPTVELGPMAAGDAGLLLETFRQADGADEIRARDQVVRRLGGHAYALTLVGREMQDSQSLVSYVGYADQLESDPLMTAAIAGPVRRALSSLDAAEVLVLQLSLLCSAAPLPARLIDRVMTELGVVVPGRVNAAAATLSALRHRLLLNRVDGVWEVHSLVRDAARAHLDPPRPPTEVAAAAATAIADLLGDEAVAATDRSLLVRHGEVVAHRVDLPADGHERLLRRIATYYEQRGEPMLASPYRERILELEPDSPHDLTALASAEQDAGLSEAALAHAVRALSLADAAGDAGLQRRGHRLIAEALDALGRPREADPHWTIVLPAEGASGEQAVDLAVWVAYARGLRLRGRLRDSAHVLRDLVGAAEPAHDPTVIDERQAALTELALVQLMTDEQVLARQTAAGVLAHYIDRGQGQHRYALAAQQVFADAQLALHLWELRPDRMGWSRAELSLRQLRDHYRASYGPRNQFTLSASVAHAHALVSLGRPAESRAELTALIPDILVRLGERHPLYLQVCFLLGQAHAQLGEYAQAVPCYTTAFHGQCAVHGPSHPHALRTQFELGIALKLTGDVRQAADMVRAVRRAAPHSTGRATDLFAQAVIATLLLRLPTWIWRSVAAPRTPGGARS